MHYPKMDICPKSGQSACERLVFVTIGLSFLGLISPSPIRAQIIPDNTLGTEHSIVTPGVDINGSPAELIQGGAVRGVNLFHSFTDFNVSNAQRVYFANPGSISRIIGRVTGNNTSFIDGTLGVAGNADLYLINPNGILFGPNAQLDINGSFLASTANGLDWGSGLEFNATNPQAPPLLTIDLPVSLTFVPGNTSVLRSEGQLTTGADLTLAAEQLELQGSVEAGGDISLLAHQQVQIRDSASQPFNATAQGDLLIQGDQGIDIFTLNHPDSWLVAGGNLTLRSDGDIIGDAHFWSSGGFTTETLSGQTANLLSPNDPIILAEGDVTLGDYLGASLHILAGGSVTLGNVEIDARGSVNGTIHPSHGSSFISSLANYTLSDGTPIKIDGSNAATGEATLDIRAGIDWSQVSGFPGNSGIGIALPPITPATGANITVGDIEMFALFRGGGHVILSNQYFSNGISGDIATGSIITRDFGGGGLTVLDSSDKITLGSSAFGFSVQSEPIFPTTTTSNGGDVRLLANGNISIPSPILVDGAVGGNIDIYTGSALNLEADLSSLSNTTTSAAQGGNISLGVVDDFVLGNGASINTSTASTANAGSIEINALGTVTFTDGAEVISTSFGTGRAGDIEVSGNNIFLTGSTNSDSTQLISKALAQGNAGNITLTAINQVLLDQGYIFASTGDGTAPLNNGNAGTVTVNANRLTLNTDPSSTITPSFIAVDSQGAGRAGSIIVNTPNGVTELIGANANGLPSAFVFNGFNTGGPGRLEVNTRELLVQDGALISGNAGEQVFALPSMERGRIDLNASERIEVTRSSLSAPSSLVLETSGGLGAGDFVASTQQFLILNGGNVSAQSIGVGDAGTLQVNANDVRISGESNGFRSRLFFESQDSGQAGGVDINANQVVVDDRGLISVRGNGTGDAGDIGITANQVTVSNSGEILASSTNGANPGDITITSGTLTMLNGGNILADADGVSGGRISFNNQSSIVLGNVDSRNIPDQGFGNNTISARVTGGPNVTGGDIRFNNVRNIIMFCCGNTISTEASNDANGGNIYFNFPAFTGGRIDSPGDREGPNSVNNDVVAIAQNGNGGFIFVDNFLALPGETEPSNFVDLVGNQRTDRSEFTAASISGTDGTVDIRIRDNLDLEALPEDFASDPLSQSCTTGGRVASAPERTRSTFTITGQGGTAPSLDAPLSGSRIRVDPAPLPSVDSDTRAPSAEADRPLPSATARSPLPATPCQPLDS